MVYMPKIKISPYKNGNMILHMHELMLYDLYFTQHKTTLELISEPKCNVIVAS